MDAASVALREAEVKATAESRAVEEARRRLTEARHTQKRLADARHEESVRLAVHKALGEFRADAFDGRVAHPLKRFSGGEQDLAGLCVRLGLSRMAARQRGVEASFAILDEVFGSQDEKRRRLITEQLQALSDAEFHQIFVITHTDDVLEHCDLAIYVTRGEDGISRAEGPR